MAKLIVTFQNFANVPKNKVKKMPKWAVTEWTHVRQDWKVCVIYGITNSILCSSAYLQLVYSKSTYQT